MIAMTPKERAQAAFDRKPSDRFSSEMASALLGREAYVGRGIQQWRQVVALGFDHDIIRASYWRCNRKPIRKLDENTFVLGRGPASRG